MADKHYFPVHAGMLTEEHRERIGKATWEFLWCLSKTTQETIEDGERVGVVLGGKPVSYKEVMNDLGGSKSTIKRNFEKLESENYITLKRTPRGQIIKVMKSKKFPRNERGAKTATGSKTGTLDDENRAISARGGAKTDHSNKDKKNYITATAEARENDQSVDTGMLPSVKEIVSTQQAVINRYLELRGSMHASPHDLSAADRIARADVPAEMAVKLLEEKFAIFEESKAWPDAKINSLRYCEGFIIERYHARKQVEQEAATDAKVRPLDSLNAKSRSVDHSARKRKQQDINNDIINQYLEENR
ncbi:hypothetical protein [Terribacillus saccharophilus]|uniref:Helix-turn-helix domain-containing protein n=1 Tax=Terribacillus saccharophilus TaxID=361277 RepID=A0ABX4H0R9_9BACI|nr:hypothetical protein [Terribacillus saccharophilus]PAD36345.1 hypothetical protein CHH56_04965 [Terribacillus saccharophilus]PAD95013.1 hypothetical protein CHH50_15520 [Terribacillus saccharophilus]PAE00720.1 hypothetical protein CHH48_05675 [Terribacillus saccharophilus]